jgi:hypothetical protein
VLVKIVENISHKEIYANLGKMMKSERVGIKKTDSKVKYLCAEVKGRIVSCVGYQMVGKKVRYKSDFTLRQFRRKGIYSSLFKKRDKMFKNEEITAFCTNKSIGMFLKEGFKVEKETEKDIKFLTREK